MNLLYTYKKSYFFSFFFFHQTIPESAFCTIITPTPPFLFEFSSFLFFLIPMTIMLFLYIRMGLRIRRTAQFGRNTAVHGESTQQQSRKAILKMLGELKKNIHLSCIFLCKGFLLIRSVSSG